MQSSKSPKPVVQNCHTSTSNSEQQFHFFQPGGAAGNLSASAKPSGLHTEIEISGDWAFGFFSTPASGSRPNGCVHNPSGMLLAISLGQNLERRRREQFRWAHQPTEEEICFSIHDISSVIYSYAPAIPVPGWLSCSHHSWTGHNKKSTGTWWLAGGRYAEGWTKLLSSVACSHILRGLSLSRPLTLASSASHCLLAPEREQSFSETTSDKATIVQSPMIWTCQVLDKIMNKREFYFFGFLVSPTWIYNQLHQKWSKVQWHLLLSSAVLFLALLAAFPYYRLLHKCSSGRTLRQSWLLFSCGMHKRTLNAYL